MNANKLHLAAVKRILLCLACVPLCACMTVRGGFTGQVLERGTNAPIEGAIVVAHWKGEIGLIAESYHDCWHVETARTDAQGRYRIPLWAMPSPGGGVFGSIEPPSIWAYKRGYAWTNKEGRHLGETSELESPDIQMEMFQGTTDERMAMLWALVRFSECNFSYGINSGKNLYRLYAPILDEAKSIATTPSQLKTTDRIKKWTNETLVNWAKPTTTDETDTVINVNPNDSYKKGDLLK